MSRRRLARRVVCSILKRVSGRRRSRLQAQAARTATKSWLLNKTTIAAGNRCVVVSLFSDARLSGAVAYLQLTEAGPPVKFPR